MEENDLDILLEKCRTEVRELQEENSHLRQAANTFGELAERLKKRLEAERRVGAERRAQDREACDRRKTAISSTPVDTFDR